MSSAPTSSPPSRTPLDGAGAVVELLRKRGPLTVTQLSESMGVARSTIAQRLGHLETAGFVRSDLRAGGSRGRPASIAAFSPSAGVILAAHIGVTGARIAVTDLDGEVLADCFRDLEIVEGADSLVRVVIEAFDGLLAEAQVDERRVAGIGVGLPRLLAIQSFVRAAGSAEEWSTDAVRGALAARYRVPTFVDLDVNLLALAEHRSSWPDAEVLICLKLGSLIDASVVVGGSPIRGAAGLAGELAHFKVRDSSALCTCGSTGCLEAVASGTAVVRDLAARGFSVTHVSEVVTLANSGVPEAMQALRDAGRSIGSALASVANLLNPAAVTAWGYLTESRLLFAGIRETLYGEALAGTTEGLTLVRTALGDLAGVRGAALRVSDEVLAPTAVDRVVVDGGWSALVG